MATFKPAAHIADIRGSIQNSTYSANRLGNYIKLRKAPMDRRTPLQNTQRSRMKDAVIAWKLTATAAQRAAWNSLGLTTTLFNPSGIAYHPSGFNLFVRMFLFVTQFYIAPTLDCPTAAASAAPTLVMRAYTNGSKTIICYDDAAWGHALTGYIRFEYSSAYAPTINSLYWQTKTTLWASIATVHAGLPFYCGNYTGGAVGDHVAITAQAYYTLPTGYTVTWPLRQVVSIIHS